MKAENFAFTQKQKYRMPTKVILLLQRMFLFVKKRATLCDTSPHLRLFHTRNCQTLVLNTHDASHLSFFWGDRKSKNNGYCSQECSVSKSIRAAMVLTINDFFKKNHKNEDKLPVTSI